jgi:hypothetical protein
MNAVKHGILSKQVLVRGQYRQENEKELEALHERFWEELQPEGPLEEMLVDQIVTAHWRLRRALTAESGEIARSVDGGSRQRNRGTDPMLQWMRWMATGDPIHAMEHSMTGLSILIDWLNEMRHRVEAEGGLTDAAVQQLTGRFGGKPNSLTLSLEALRKEQEANPTDKEAKVPDHHRTAALAFLDRKLRHLQMQRERCDEEEYYAEEANQAAAELPSSAVLDKIMRYETKLERQMYRAMAQLERVQRLRNGEAIPAPLSVHVSDRG